MLRSLVLSFFFALSLPAGAIAQDGGKIEPTAGDRSDAIGERLKVIEADASLDDLTKNLLSDRYKSALESVQNAKAFRDSEDAYRNALAGGQRETEQIRNQIESLSAQSRSRLPDGIGPDSPSQDLDAARNEARATAASIQEELKGVNAEISTIRSRPTEIRARLGALSKELSDVEGQLERLAAVESGDRVGLADLAKKRAQKLALEAEQAALTQEDLSEDIRKGAAEAKRDLLTVEFEIADSMLKALDGLASSQLLTSTQRAKVLAKRVREAEAIPEQTEESLRQLEDMVSKSEEAFEALAWVDTSMKARREEHERISVGLEGLKQQIEIGGLEGTLGQVMLELLRSLPTERSTSKEVALIHKKLTDARRAKFEIERMNRLRTADGPPDAGGLDAEIWNLSEALSTDLRSAYNRLIRGLGDLELEVRQIEGDAEKLADYAVEKLFWVRSSPFIGGETFATLWDGLVYCYGRDRWRTFWSALTSLPAAFHIFVLLLMLAITIPRRRFRRWLTESGFRTKRISTDRFLHTAVALTATALLAAPLPALMILYGAALIGEQSASPWVYTVGAGLIGQGLRVFLLLFSIVMCRPGGLAEAHFGWSRNDLRRVGMHLAWLIPVYIVSDMTMRLVQMEPTASYLNGLGRLNCLTSIIAVGIIVGLILHPEKGAAAALHRAVPQSWIGRLRKVWFRLAVAVVVLLIGFLAFGFVVTAILLVSRIEISMSVSVIFAIAYGLVLRWISIRARKLALEEALDKRRARQEAAHNGGEDIREEGGEVVDGIPIGVLQEAEQMGLDEVGDQTRSLVSFLVGVCLLAALYQIWTSFAPVLNVLDRFSAFGKFSIADIWKATLIISVTAAMTKNLPGLLEVVILRRLGLDNGTRNAIMTLGQYFVVAVGAAILFQQIGVDWSKFGWIAAALSVGLGFGLQEVVANFISGLILLFERPIRVGDIVTVDGIDGVVSRIQIRATTITDWNRKEFVVPNKNFITGTLMNWTLSNSTNRILIPVGVAYGTDTRKARDLLLAVARDHPRILDDPHPVASFEAFADSSLSLYLRCYLPDMDNRLGTITELHTGIDERFKAAGIEIAFPQQDLHLRSIDPDVKLGAPRRD